MTNMNDRGEWSNVETGSSLGKLPSTAGSDARCSSVMLPTCSSSSIGLEHVECTSFYHGGIEKPHEIEHCL